MPTKTMTKTKQTATKTAVNRTNTKPPTRRTYNNSTIVAGGKELATAGRTAVSGVAKLLKPVRNAASNVSETALNTVANTLNIGEETVEYKIHRLSQKEKQKIKNIEKNKEELVEIRSQIRRLLS